MATRIQLRRGISTTWTTDNPELAQGEVGFETDTGKFKIGDGIHLWNSLSYATLKPSEITDAISASSLGTTDDLPEGVQNLYYTDARVGDYISNNHINLQGTQGVQGTFGTQGSQGTTGSQGTQGAVSYTHLTLPTILRV